MTKRFVLLAALLLGIASPALAGELEGVKMPDRVEIAGKSLVLNGMGVRKATFLKVRVYVAGLYLERRSSDPQVVMSSAQVKRLVLHFVHDATRNQIVDAWKEGFEKNGGRSAPLRDRMKQLDGFMTDFHPGDTLAFTVVPARGVDVAVKGVVRGTIPGDDFARALLSIWFGREPPNEDLKTGLLGRH